ncbi:unnamed protein product, partial [marine sediment metagenome]
GMLINLGMLLAMDCYGPIADNSAGIAQMADLGKEVRERCEALDSVGNTTAALGKGFAIASAALASLAWLATYFAVSLATFLSKLTSRLVFFAMVKRKVGFQHTFQPYFNIRAEFKNTLFTDADSLTHLASGGQLQKPRDCLAK